MTPEQAELLIKRAALTNLEWAEKNHASVAITEFLKRHKAYLNSDGNKDQMKLFLKQHGLEGTVANLEKAYYSLANAGLLSIDKSVFKKEEVERQSTARAF